MKKIIILIFISIQIFSQSYKINTIGVIDITRVYEAFYANSEQVRAFEKLKQEYVNELKKATDDIENLKLQKFEADRQNNTSLSQNLAKKITDTTRYINEYKEIKKIEIKNKENALKQDNDFFKVFNTVIDTVAQQNGVSAVLSRDNPYLIWWATSVDLTDKTIEFLKTYYKN